MRKLEWFMCGTRELEYLPKNESLKQRSELSSVLPYSLKRQVTKRCEKTRIEEMYSFAGRE